LIKLSCVSRVFWGPAGGQGKDGCLLVFWAQKVCNW